MYNAPDFYAQFYAQLTSSQNDRSTPSPLTFAQTSPQAHKKLKLFEL